MHEILEMPSWQAGTTVDVEGVVTGVDRWNTTYGPVVMLSLDGAQGCWMVFGNPAMEYVAGERFRTTLHFQEYRINGERAVMAPELVCPLPTMYISLAVLSEASMLQSRGVGLAFSLYEPDGWATYEVITRNRDAYPLDIFPLAL